MSNSNMSNSNTPSGNEPSRNELNSNVSDASRRERGQTTSEYALVLLAAGTIAMLAVSWAQGGDAIGGLFDAVMARITELMT